MAKIMITNDGPHPAEKWAITTAEMIFPIDQSVDGERLMQARRLEQAIVEALVPHHSNHQHAERHALKEHGDAHLDVEHNPLSNAQQALSSIVSAAKGTPWEAHFLDAAVQHEVLQVIGNHMASAAHIERQWHCNRNPNSERARAWAARHHS